jgi:hypothetical protein
VDNFIVIVVDTYIVIVILPFLLLYLNALDQDANMRS